MAEKGLVASIIKFLMKQLEDGDITADSRESLEVAIQCLESAYSVQATDSPANFDLLNTYKVAVENFITLPPSEATDEEKAEAEKYKNEGNNLMGKGNVEEAIEHYSNYKLDGHNAVYYCNRAAAYSKINNHREAIKDCKTALVIDNKYSKAYGRMGLAYSSLNEHKEAKECYEKALEIEPTNESYKNNLHLTEEKLAQQGVSNIGLGGAGNVPGFPDMSSLLSHPVLMNMARQMLADPGMQNVMTEFMSGNVESNDRMEALIQAGQQLAQQMQSANPELIDLLRRQMGGNPNDPDPPQQN